MKKNLLIVFGVLLTVNSFAQAPQWAWAKSAGGTNDDRGNSVASDASGNVYVTGNFGSPTISFGATTLTDSGYTDIFLAKYDPTGNVLWANSSGGTSYENSTSVATDVSGNVYITGYFYSSTITFGTTTLTNVGAYDMFLVKYNSAGNVLWAKSVGGTNADEAQSVTVDPSGNIYVTGTFTSPTITFGTTTLTNLGLEDIFLVKYNSGGNVLWAISGGGISIEEAFSVTTDNIGNVYITGYYSSPSISFSGLSLPNPNNNDMFIVKYSPFGVPVWAKSAGSSNDEKAYSVATDASDNVYVAGCFRSPTITFDTITLTNTNTTSNYYDIFFVKYDANGNVIWAKKDIGAYADDVPYSVTTDASGNLYLAGYSQSPTITFGSTTLYNFNINKDIFLAKYDSGGNVLWAKNAGAYWDEFANSVATDNFGNVYITGSFLIYDFNFGADTLVNVGSYDMFLAKIDTNNLYSVYTNITQSACNSYTLNNQTYVSS